MIHESTTLAPQPDAFTPSTPSVSGLPVTPVPLSADEIDALRSAARLVLAQHIDATAQSVVRGLAHALKVAGQALEQAALSLNDVRLYPQSKKAHEAGKVALQQAKDYCP